MCSDLFESNGKKVVEGWKRIQYMLLSVHVVRFRKKTITLAPNIEGLGADERDDGSSPPPKIESPLPPYSAVRHTLHLLRTGAAEYAQYTKQLSNVRKQSTRAPPPTLLWRKLPVTRPATLRSMASTFNVPLESYSRYLRETYKEWQPKSECS